MEPAVRSVTWEAPEHHHVERGGDWFFALSIITVAIVIAALFFGNFLMALLAGLCGLTASISAARPPRIVEFSVSPRGIRVDQRLYPYTTLESYHIDEDDPRGPQLLVMSQKHFMPLLVLPIPEEYIDDIEEILSPRLPEEFLEEPLFTKMLELVGF
jgi:hypothetical protein